MPFNFQVFSKSSFVGFVTAPVLCIMPCYLYHAVSRQSLQIYSLDSGGAGPDKCWRRSVGSLGLKQGPTWLHAFMFSAGQQQAGIWRQTIIIMEKCKLQIQNYLKSKSYKMRAHFIVLKRSNPNPM